VLNIEACARSAAISAVQRDAWDWASLAVMAVSAVAVAAAAWFAYRAAVASRSLAAQADRDLRVTRLDRLWTTLEGFRRETGRDGVAARQTSVQTDLARLRGRGTVLVKSQRVAKMDPDDLLTDPKGAVDAALAEVRAAMEAIE